MAARTASQHVESAVDLSNEWPGADVLDVQQAVGTFVVSGELLKAMKASVCRQGCRGRQIVSCITSFNIHDCIVGWCLGVETGDLVLLHSQAVNSWKAAWGSVTLW